MWRKVLLVTFATFGAAIGMFQLWNIVFVHPLQRTIVARVETNDGLVCEVWKEWRRNSIDGTLTVEWKRGNTVVGWTQLLSGVEFPDDVQFETAKYNSANDNVVLLFSQPYNGVQLSLPAFRPGVGSMRDFVLQNKVHVKTTISP